jgi:hypothetical protein
VEDEDPPPPPGATITTGVSVADALGDALGDADLAALGVADGDSLETGPALAAIGAIGAGVFNSSITPGSVVAPTTPVTGSPSVGAVGEAGASVDSVVPAGACGAGALSSGAAATPSRLTGPAAPAVDASNVCVTTVFTEIIVVVGSDTNISGSDDAGGASGADSAEVSGSVIKGLIGAVSAISSGDVVSPSAETGPANPATDAPTSVASAITIVCGAATLRLLFPVAFPLFPEFPLDGVLDGDADGDADAEGVGAGVAELLFEEEF